MNDARVRTRPPEKQSAAPFHSPQPPSLHPTCMLAFSNSSCMYALERVRLESSLSTWKPALRQGANQEVGAGDEA